MSNNSICLPCLIVLVLCSFFSVLFIDHFGVNVGITNYYYFVSDSNKILALLIAVFLFLAFRNLNISYSLIINNIASTTYGILCIHASSNAMRNLLWNTILKVPNLYYESLFYLIGYALISTIMIFVLCSIIKLFRIKVIEKPLFELLDKYNFNLF